MELEKILALCLVVLLVVGLNGWFIAYFRRGGSIGEIELFRRAAKAARNPWEREESDLAELRRLVAEFESDPERAEQPSESPAE